MDCSTKRITPNCCEESKKGTVYMCLTDSYETNSLPLWKSLYLNEKYEATHSIEVSFCPHCGTKLPEIEPNPEAYKLKICEIIDGGYYCYTCGDRLNECQCYSSVFKWRPKS